MVPRNSKVSLRLKNERVLGPSTHPRYSFFVHVHLHHIHKCSLNRARRSPITRLSHLSYLSPRQAMLFNDIGKMAAEGKPFFRRPTSLFATSSLQSANQFLSHRAERTLGYAIDGRISSGSPLLAEMNGSEGGAGFYFRAGREEERKRVLSSNLSRPVSRGVENPDRLRESLALFSPSFRHSKGVYSTHSPVFRTAQVSVRLRMRTSFPSAHSPFTRFSKQRRKGGQQVPRALCPTHLSRSKCSSPVPPNAPISRQRSCECAVMLRMLRHRIDRPSSRSFPVHSLYISDTQGRTRWEGSSPSLCPADHSAGILHSRLRLTAARGWSCRYVSLSGSLAPPVISFYDMLLSSPYSICNLVISASLRVSTHLRKKRRTSFSDSAIAL
ncbi:hypothetical protein V8G54_037910 (chloroplast) [Vigna mungo]|uniref:Uncharacterized protein n=2 Tax=Vigna TaxID=3913 RepID=A0AAQ3MDD4_VIGMU